MQGNSATVNDSLSRIVARIVARLNPEEIWLFGSRAEGRNRPDSDFDLLAVLPDGAAESELDPVNACDVVAGLGVPVDLIPCTRSEFNAEQDEPDSLVKAAVSRGRRIYVAAQSH